MLFILLLYRDHTFTYLWSTNDVLNAVESFLHASIFASLIGTGVFSVHTVVVDKRTSQPLATLCLRTILANGQFRLIGLLSLWTTWFQWSCRHRRPTNCDESKKCKEGWKEGSGRVFHYFAKLILLLVDFTRGYLYLLNKSYLIRTPAVGESKLARLVQISMYLLPMGYTDISTSFSKYMIFYFGIFPLLEAHYN